MVGMAWQEDDDVEKEEVRALRTLDAPHMKSVKFHAEGQPEGE